MLDEVYCKRCEIEIKQSPIPFLSASSYKFKDGTYCEKCARLMVDKRRKKN